MAQKQLTIALSLLLLAVIGIGGVALAQSSPNLNLEWHVIAAGGGPSGSANYVVHSTIGQGLAGGEALSSEHYVVNGGFLFAEAPYPHRIYLPLVARTSP